MWMDIYPITTRVSDFTYSFVPGKAHGNVTTGYIKDRRDIQLALLKRFIRSDNLRKQIDFVDENKRSVEKIKKPIDMYEVVPYDNSNGYPILSSRERFKRYDYGNGRVEWHLFGYASYLSGQGRPFTCSLRLLTANEIQKIIENGIEYGGDM